MKISFFFLSSFFIFSSSFGNTHFVSDIDDTIKRTHVLGTMLRGLRSTNSFTGLRELYMSAVCFEEEGQECLNVSTENTNTTENITYVSAAPRVVSYFARRFLRKSDFPKGELISKPSFRMPSDVFKIEAIKGVIEKSEAERVILIGDNGEKDVMAYHTVANLFNTKTIKSYIHQVYATEGDFEDIGVKLEEGQKGYLTAIDLGLEFVKEKLISKKDFKKIVDIVLADLTNLKTIGRVLPSWIRCHEFTKNYKRPFVIIDPLTFGKVLAAENIAKLRCKSLAEKN